MCDELGLFVDFMVEIMKKEGYKLIGICGMFCVGKIEFIVVVSVCVNKRWLFVLFIFIK